MFSYDIITVLLAYIAIFPMVHTPVICVSAPAILYSPHLASDKPSFAVGAPFNEFIICAVGVSSYVQLNPKSRLSLLAVLELEDVFIVFSSVFFCTVMPMLTLGGVFTIAHNAWDLIRCTL
ncbi:hypothetical protein BOTBODRAFT_184583 [Botryobasidium botryosum FD-172 SS1]|uniref:Uncharacterized protein n=1 Tax=Botryobasidium botryosum (strain FD-172 SS1) TaxID=930990 RepID=A0A067MVH2_BOTB1|nr:hypothetical protein BOTBODRAFT_184583 [Botryobasidium botryosum FD-172 SS1]